MGVFDNKVQAFVRKTRGKSRVLGRAGAFCERGGRCTPSVFHIKKAASGGKSLFYARDLFQILKTVRFFELANSNTQRFLTWL